MSWQLAAFLIGGAVILCAGTIFFLRWRQP